jgi:hypothetical protein
MRAFHHAHGLDYLESNMAVQDQPDMIARAFLREESNEICPAYGSFDAAHLSRIHDI